MRLMFILCFLFTLPIVGVLGYDAYHYYETRQDNPLAPFNFSEIGFIWYTYSEDTHNKVVKEAYKELGSDSWENMIKPALRWPAVAYAAGLAGIVYLITFLFWLFAIWPANRVRKVKGTSSAFSSYVHKKKSFKYNRK